MKTEFTLYKENSNRPIIVNETTNNFLLKRCQDNWYHTLDIKYLQNYKWYSKIGFKKLSFEKQKTDFVFIHIPKTGGISFKFNVIYNPYMQKKISIYHKINYPAKPKPELDIFEEKRTMFTLLRDPTSTVISAYYHFNHFLKMTFADFYKQFTNMQTKFLLGYDIFSSIKVDQKDVNKIIKLIDEKRLIVGVHQQESMKDIYDLLELPHNKVDNYVLNKKKYLDYKPSDISNAQKKQIKQINLLDNMLYDYVIK